jgi:hypothetical protein
MPANAAVHASTMIRSSTLKEPYRVRGKIMGYRLWKTSAIFPTPPHPTGGGAGLIGMEGVRRDGTPQLDR